MIKAKFVIATLTTFGLLAWPTTKPKAEINNEQQSLYIGIEKKRKPYTYLDDKQEAQGILVEAIKSTCQSLQLSCQFVGGQLEDSLQALRTAKLDAVVIIDASLPPDADALQLNHPPVMERLKLTESLCQSTPAFLYKKTGKPKTSFEDFKEDSIGVLEGSAFHYYLLQKYNKLAHVKVYPILEAGIVDLVFERGDAIFTEDAFLNDRVLNSAIDEYGELSVAHIDRAGFPTTMMTLALRERDIDLLKQLNKVLTPAKHRICSDLLSSKPEKLAIPHP